MLFLRRQDATGMGTVWVLMFLSVVAAGCVL